MTITKNSQIDLNGNEMILDADGDTTITADTDDQIDIKTAGTDRVQINSTGDFLVRQTSADVYDTNTGGTVRQYWGNQFSAQNNTNTRVIIGSASNAGLVGGATVNSGGTRPIVNSYISFGSTNQTAGSEAGMIQFYTSTGGAAGANRARIDSDGLKFGSDTSANNALDDYETGTFTPTVVSGITSVSYATNVGYYTKIGDTIMISLRVALSAGTLQSSLLSFAGLPEAARTSTYGAGYVSYTSSFANQNINFYVNPGSTQLSVYKQIGTNFAGNDLVSYAFDLRLMLAYLT